MTQYLQTNTALPVMGLCLCVGYVIKNAIPGQKINRFIPLIMAVLGSFCNLWLCHFTLTPQTLLIGMLSGLSSTGVYELFRNFLENPKG